MEGPGPRLIALGTAGAPAPGRFTTSFQLSGGILIDAGAAAHTIPLDARRELQRILLSHAHLDHSLGVPFLIGRQPYVVHALPETIASVQSGLLNGTIWPDTAEHATWKPIAIDDQIRHAGWEIEVGPASHTIPCVSFLCRHGEESVLVAGDTRYDDELVDWALAHRPDHLVLECSFEDELAELAAKWGHQTPRDLRRWREALGPDPQFWITHVKPLHESAVRAECEALGDPNLRILRDGDIILE